MDRTKLFKDVKCLGCVILRVGVVLILLVGGLLAMRMFAAMKKPPARQPALEPVFQVNALRAEPDDVQVVLEGFGTARAKQRVNLSPQVQGRIVRVNPKLQVGQILDTDELIIEIDQRDYEIVLAQTKAELQRLKAERDRLETAWENDKRRLKIAESSLELARSDYNRVKMLFEDDEVGTLAGVEQAESRLNQQRDAVVSLENAIALYPVSLAENQARIAAAQSAVERAQLDLERTEIRTPFQGRVAFEDAEIGQVVAPGTKVVTLVDDSVLEIPVSLDSRDAELWLPLSENTNGSSWILLESERPAYIYWVQDAQERSKEGRLARVENYDEDTRTLVVVVEIVQKLEHREDFPIVEGMFCRVEIPGKIAEDVFELPAIAVSHENTVILSVSNRIETLPVNVVYRSGSEVLVQQGLEPGDLVVTSRMAKVVEGASLELTIEQDVKLQ